ncbi:MAG: oligosaccharide flippase family protein, partial [Paracoccaceae bacterium]
MFRTIFLILSSNVTGSLILMARNLLIAGLLSLEDYGITSTFVLAMAIIEMLSEIGLQQQMVQAGKGNDTRFQAALHGFKLIRGAMNGAILFLIAPLVAQFFRQPELTWAYQVTALVPVIMAFGHSDVTRLRRQMRFWPNFVVNTVPKLVSTLAVWPLFLILPDYRLMIAILILQSLVFTLCTFLVAERRYQLAFDRAFMTDSLRFGWPLLLNGLLMFAVFNGER